MNALGWFSQMNWIPLLVIAVLWMALLLWKRASFVSVATARQLLHSGALIIDVRSPEEFRSGHVATAIHVPLGELSDRMPSLVGDVHKPLLVHCLSGGRSALAVKRLRELGYTEVYNLGSLSRAEAIAGSSGTLG